MYFYFIIALQAYCLYHVYTRRKAFYWWLLILFLPLIGCIIYIITQVYNKRDAEKITSDITQIINPAKKIKDLEKQLEFSESYQNRVNLADAYLENKDYKNAIPYYLESIEDNQQNDLYVIKQLIECYFNLEDYDRVVLYAEKIKDTSEFKKSKTPFLYGLGLEKVGRIEEAEANLKTIDVRYSFYEERLILAKFLISREKKEEAKEILTEIQTESKYMTKPNQRIYRLAIQEVEKLLSEMN